MKHYRYLIIGGGMTADAAMQGIRQVDPQGSIGLFSAEANPPYRRPPLSKALWKGKSFEMVWLKMPEAALETHLGTRITALDLHAKTVRDERDQTYSYEKLLLATGGRPRRLPFGDGKLIYYRTVDDYQRLRGYTGQGKRFAILGGGFIGSEVAAALAMNHEHVTMVFPDRGIGSRLFPADLAGFINEYYRQKGVEVLSGALVSGVEMSGEQLLLKLDKGEALHADYVVAGLGILPDTDLASSAGLKVENGIVVDDYLHASHADVFAAGDVANFYNPVLDVRLRVEHEDNALTMGNAAGVNMAREVASQDLQPYHHLPFFYSDLFELGYEAVGELDSRLEMVSLWQEPFRKGVVYYLKNGRVRGVLLWDVWGKVDQARELIAEPGPIMEQDLRTRWSFMS
jgi:NADPH-dependent 2,4-dienoyl-CoA reductase/sulfur reductase-like enzyme